MMVSIDTRPDGSLEARTWSPDGELIDRSDSSGCIYNDLGCCQGCPTCRLDFEDER